MPNADYRLESERFSVMVSCGKKEWRETQVQRVLSSFRTARTIMSRQAIKVLYGYLVKGEWIHDATIPCHHPAYKHLTGYGRIQISYYYPFFFVLQAIYPITTGIRDLCRRFQDYWGIDIHPTRAFYPRLQDSERELALIKGRKAAYKPASKVPRKKFTASHASSTVTTQSVVDTAQVSKVTIQESNNEQASTTTNTAQPETPSNSNALNNYEEQLTSIRGDFERRLSEFQNQLHKDATGSWEESGRRLREVQDKTKEIREHAVKAKDHAAKAHENAVKAQEHSDTAAKLADALIESLNTPTERPGIVVPDRERPSKRVRKN
ncbi:hypothetical protein IL306_009708 [Fusarium sp. DS 682]|nr:hypothetical protein IL306_009708 [Fusarium sp. DS 682]